jgi:hypothetical protein
MIKVQRPNRPRPLGRVRPRGDGYVPPLPNLYCGLDLGQAHDFSALAVAESILPKPTLGHDDDWGPMLLPHYHVRALERAPLGTPYPVIARSMATMLRQPPFRGTGTLVVDATGVGRPVVDSLREAGLAPVAVTITGGQRLSGGRRGGYRVPKNDLVSNLILLFQQRRLKIASTLHHAPTLISELENMRMRITASGNDQYGAYGQGEHDDFVLSLALAVWYAERLSRRDRRQQERMGSAEDQVIGEGLMT